MKLSKPYHIKDFKFLLVLSVLALSIIGVLAVGSAEPSSQMKQIIGIIMGIIVMVIISMIDYEWLLNLYWLIYTLFGNGIKWCKEVDQFRFYNIAAF